MIRTEFLADVNLLLIRIHVQKHVSGRIHIRTQEGTNLDAAIFALMALCSRRRDDEQ